MKSYSKFFLLLLVAKTQSQSCQSLLQGRLYKVQVEDTLLNLLTKDIPTELEGILKRLELGLYLVLNRDRGLSELVKSKFYSPEGKLLSYSIAFTQLTPELVKVEMEQPPKIYKNEKVCEGHIYDFKHAIKQILGDKVMGLLEQKLLEKCPQDIKIPAGIIKRLNAFLNLKIILDQKNNVLEGELFLDTEFGFKQKIAGIKEHNMPYVPESLNSLRNNNSILKESGERKTYGNIVGKVASCLVGFTIGSTIVALLVLAVKYIGNKKEKKDGEYIDMEESQ